MLQTLNSKVKIVGLALGIVLASGFLALADSSDASAASCEDGSISCIVVQFGKLTGDRTVNPSSNIYSATQFQLPVSVNIKHDPGYKVDYTVRVYGSGSSLTSSDNTSASIPSVLQDTSYNDLGKNGSEWGMRWSLGENDLYANYHPVPSSSDNAVAIYDGTMDRDITDLTEKLTLGFAVAVDGNQASGSYSNTVTIAIVASPKDLRNSIFDIANMQEMTPEICAGTTTPSKAATTLFDTDGSHAGDASYVPETTLTDVRDGKTYLVRKLADGNCWMSQNLSLNLVANQELTNRTTDLNSKRSWAPTHTTQTGTGTAWGQNDDKDHSSSSGWNQYWAGGTIFNSTGAAAQGGTAGYAQRGNYYNWFAATAGSGKSTDANSTTDGDRIVAGTVQDSICPKGWTLPVGNTTDINKTDGSVKSFYNLVQLYTGQTGNISSATVNTLYASPMHFVPAGSYGYSNGVLNNVGGRQLYRSGTAATSATSAWTLFFYSDMVYPGTANHDKGYGFSVRCVAR